LSQGGGNYCNIIGFHDYTFEPTPELRVQTIPTIEAILQQYDQPQKPLWDTETTYASTDFASALASAQVINPSTTSATLQAGFLARTYLLNWAYGASTVSWYAWDNGVWAGIFPLQSNDTTLTPAGIAYQNVEQWMVGSVMHSLTYDAAGDYEISLTMSNGSNAMIVWNGDNASTTINLPASFQPTTVTNLAGVQSAYAGGTTIAIGVEPILLTTTTTAAAVATAPAASVTNSANVISAYSTGSTIAVGLESLSPAPKANPTIVLKTQLLPERLTYDQPSFKVRGLVKMTRGERNPFPFSSGGNTSDMGSLNAL
jgi:hypothetical protein